MAREVGIHIKIYDAATAGFKKISGAIDGFATRARKNFKDFTGSFTTINQGLEIMKKGFMTLDRTIGASLRRALDFRHSWDPAKKAMIEFGRNAETLQARLGDMLVPALAGLAKAFSEVTTDVLKWTEANEKAIQKDVLAFVVELSGILATTMVTGVHMATKAWTGLTMIWHQAAAAKAGVERALIGTPLPGSQGEKRALELEEIIDRSNAATVKAAQQQETTEQRLEQIAESIGRAKQLAAQYGEEFIDSSSRANTATKELEDTWRKHREAAEKAMDAAMEKVDAMIQKEAEALRAWDQNRAERIRGFDQLIAAYGDDVEAYQKSIAAKKASELKAAVDAQKAIKQKQDEANDEQRRAIEENVSMMTTAYNSIRAIGVEAFTGIGKGGEDARANAVILNKQMAELQRSMQGLSGAELQVAKQRMADLRVELGLTNKEMLDKTKTWGDAFASFFKNLGKLVLENAANFVVAKGIEAAASAATAKKEIAANAAGAASGAAKSQAGIPIIGPILAAVAMVAMFALVMGLAGKFYKGGEIPRAAGGFMVPNTGGAGRDSVMIQAMPGERVLTRAESRNYAQTSMRGASAATAPAMNINEGGPVTNVSVNTFGGAAEVQRVIRDNLEKQRAALLRRGHIKA